MGGSRRIVVLAIVLALSLVGCRRSASTSMADVSSEPDAGSLEPRGESPVFASEVEGLDDEQIIAALGWQIDSESRYAGTYVTNLGGEQDAIATLTWRTLVEVVRHVPTAHGTVIVLQTTVDDLERSYSGAPTDGDVAWFEQQGPVSGTTRFLLMAGRVYEVPPGGWDEDGDRPTASYMQEIDDRYPEWFFPVHDGLSWSSLSAERADLEASASFRAGEGPAPNPGFHYWIVGCSPFSGDPPKEAIPLCRYELTGTTERWFVPGRGLVREQYSHHGTLIESDLVRID